MQEPNWYAVYTRSRHEKQVDLLLRRQALDTYLPLLRTWSRWRDRRVTLEVPALPGYLFVHCHLYGEVRARIKKTPGVVSLVEQAGSACVIPVREIESLRLALDLAKDVSPYPNLKVGDLMEVIRGPLIGAQGYLERVAAGRHRLIIRVQCVNQAIAVEVDAADVERCQA